MVALLTLLASVACGTVDPKAAFKGSSDDIVIIVASALVISTAAGRSGIVEAILRKVASRLHEVKWQLTVRSVRSPYFRAW